MSFKNTSDKSIRTALREELQTICLQNQYAKIIEELGISHGAARVDIAVVNGVIHGYELKSDLDTLNRLPEQMKIFNSVLDHVTLVVGKNHLHEAIKIIPEWWGITLAKAANVDDSVSLYNIRDAEDNPKRDSVSIASLLWRSEALEILEELNEANGVRSKPRSVLYERLANVLNQEALRAKVREYLTVRIGWRSEKQRMSYDD